MATGDAHYLDKTDAVYRKILIHSQGGANPLNRHSLPDVHFRSTKEMLDAFSWLPEDQAHQIVVDNTHVVADWIDGSITPVKTKLYTPDIPGVKENLTKDVMDTAHKLYGDPLPEIVSARLDKELKSIIGNGFAVIYNIAQQLVLKSNKDGYLVGSRGSVGSSLAATMSGITEINHCRRIIAVHSVNIPNSLPKGNMGPALIYRIKIVPTVAQNWSKMVKIFPLKLS